MHSLLDKIEQGIVFDGDEVYEEAMNALSDLRVILALNGRSQ